MKSLENRTLDSKREMDIMAALDEMKSMKVHAFRILVLFFEVFGFDGFGHRGIQILECLIIFHYNMVHM